MPARTACAVAIALGEPDQDHVAGAALDERSDRRAVPGSHDQITFPETGLGAVFDLGRPLVDHPHRGQPPAALQPAQTPAASPATRRAGQRNRRS